MKTYHVVYPTYTTERRPATALSVFTRPSLHILRLLLVVYRLLVIRFGGCRRCANSCM